MNKLDFDGLNAALLPNLPSLLPGWIPGGKLVGREYMAGSINGGPGDSFRFNVSKGIGQDFASDDKYGDAIALYAGVKRMSMGEAAKELATQIGFNLSPNGKTSRTLESKPEQPPPGTPPPAMTHPAHGSPSSSWCYRDSDGNPLFYVARYETASGKQLCPWSWMGGRWAAKGWPEPRPLYGLEVLKAMPEAPVVIVEGEKAADAARKIIGTKYAVITWPNGSNAVDKADWSPLKDRSVLIWPDADEPGILAARKIAGIPGYKSVKIISTEGHPEKWDAADAAAEGWDFRKFVEWVKPRMQPVAVSVTTSEDPAEPVSQTVQAIVEDCGLLAGRDGRPICNLNNIIRVFDGYPPLQGIVWSDTFHKRIFTTWKTGEKREWRDVDTLDLTNFLQENLGMTKLSDDVVFKSICLYADQHRRNEPKDWMESLVWDKTSRISSFFSDCMGARDSAYTKAAATNFWIGMVARIYRPGCQLDNMVILEGSQGIGKTKALRTICGDWYATATESIQNKDFFMALSGKMIVEIAELDAFGKADITRIKQVISTPVDRYRSSYARTSEDNPRMSIFVGTTNEDCYLKDNTGARRFWPVRCGNLDLERISRDREQMFAEAVTRFKAGETWYEMPVRETKDEQETRRQSDEWENMLNEYLLGRDEVTMTEIGSFLELGRGNLSMAEQHRIGKCLKVCGWERRSQRFGDLVVKKWLPVTRRDSLPRQPDLPEDPY